MEEEEIDFKEFENYLYTSGNDNLCNDADESGLWGDIEDSTWSDEMFISELEASAPPPPPPSPIPEEEKEPTKPIPIRASLCCVGGKDETKKLFLEKTNVQKKKKEKKNDSGTKITIISPQQSQLNTLKKCGVNKKTVPKKTVPKKNNKKTNNKRKHKELKEEEEVETTSVKLQKTKEAQCSSTNDVLLQEAEICGLEVNSQCTHKGHVETGCRHVTFLDLDSKSHKCTACIKKMMEETFGFLENAKEELVVEFLNKKFIPVINMDYEIADINIFATLYAADRYGEQFKRKILTAVFLRKTVYKKFQLII